MLVRSHEYTLVVPHTVLPNIVPQIIFMTGTVHLLDEVLDCLCARGPSLAFVFVVSVCVSVGL